MKHEQAVIPDQILRTFEAALIKAEKKGEPVPALYQAAERGEWIDVSLEGNVLVLSFDSTKS